MGYQINLILLMMSLSLATGIEWDDLRCKFSALDIFRIDSFFQLPRTVAAAKSKGWQQWDEQPPENKHIRTFCEKNDPRICLLYDDSSYIAGYQISIPRVVDSLRMPGIDYERMGFKSKVIFGGEQYVLRLYFISPESINANNRVWDGQTGAGLWIPIKGRYVEIPKRESDLISKIPEYKAQNCYNKMGKHYFYNMSRALKPVDFYPIFLLYSKQGELHGWGLNAFGSEAVSEPFSQYIPFLKKRNWFENIPTSKIRNVAPDAPQWSLDYKDEYGAYSHHVYFVNKPWDIEC